MAYPSPPIGSNPQILPAGFSFNESGSSLTLPDGRQVAIMRNGSFSGIDLFDFIKLIQTNSTEESAYYVRFTGYSNKPNYPLPNFWRTYDKKVCDLLVKESNKSLVSLILSLFEKFVEDLDYYKAIEDIDTDILFLQKVLPIIEWGLKTRKTNTWELIQPVFGLYREKMNQEQIYFAEEGRFLEGKFLYISFDKDIFPNILEHLEKGKPFAEWSEKDFQDFKTYILGLRGKKFREFNDNDNTKRELCIEGYPNGWNRLRNRGD